jgi:hypothetical protein
MNLKKGFFRIYIFLSVIWISLFIFYLIFNGGNKDFKVFLIPIFLPFIIPIIFFFIIIPIFKYVLKPILNWLINGFKQN